MKLFKSKLLNAGIYILLKVILIIILMAIPLFFLDLHKSILNFAELHWISITCITFCLFYIYIGFTNTDIKIENDFISFEGKLFPFKKNHKVKIEDISEITMQHDRSDTLLNNFKPKFLKYIIVECFLKSFLAVDYKWIEIIVNNKSYKYYCFGLEYDYYDNPQPHFEDLYIELAKLNLNVNWTKNNDFYFKDLTKRKEEIQKNSHS